MNSRDAALNYLHRFRWNCIAVPYGSKNPGKDGWQSLRLNTPDLIRQHFNRQRQNIGLLTGEPSDRTVDVDLDWIEAAAIARSILPETRSFGRKNKPWSHRLYRIDRDHSIKKFQVSNSKAGTVVELRGTGHQTILPPSIHEHGDLIAWENDLDPLLISLDELLRLVARVAFGAAMIRLWPRQRGCRHDAALAMAGGLLQSGCSIIDAEKLVQAITEAANDSEVHDRKRAVKDTDEDMRAGKPVTGWMRLGQLLGETVGTISKWIGGSVQTGGTENLTELWNARRFVTRHGEDVRFCHDLGMWLNWDASCWQKDTTNEVARLAKETVVSLYSEASGTRSWPERKALVDHARKSESNARITALLALAESEPEIATTSGKFDTDNMLLNCRNGTVDLRTGELRDHARSDLMSKIVDIDFNPASPCTQWNDFLGQVMAGNSALVDFLQVAAGYSLTGLTDEQCIFILHGGGSNGKTTFVEVLRSLLGDYGKTIPPESLLMRRPDAATNDIAELRGARLVVSTEFSDGSRLNEGRIKSLTGGDTIKARFLYKEFFEFRPQFKLWISTNHKPRVRGIDHAIWRRIRLIPFNVTFEDTKKDLRLKQKLLKELPGILAWAVRGCLYWQSEGLTMPEEVKEATNEYRREMDLFAQFLKECCIQSPSLESTARALYERYRQWCGDSAEEAMSTRSFGLRLGQLNFARRESNGNVYWRGLGLVEKEKE